MNRKNATHVLVVLSAIFMLGSSADAALKKYDLTFRGQVSSTNVTPNPQTGNPINNREFSTALISNAAGPNPVLRKFVRAVDFTITTLVPGLVVGIFASTNFREGPGVPAQLHQLPVPSFTGTGSTAASIRWGSVTGWSISGSNWCNSEPAVVCSLAMNMDEQTTEPRFNSEFYDLGTWSFHGTGFTAIPFIGSYFSSDIGNQTYWVRGFEKRDGTVPALPLVGAVTLGLSLVAGGVAAARRKSN